MAAAAPPILPYEPALYNSLPGILDAGRRFEERGARSRLAEIGAVLVKHGLEKRLGLILLHNHFPMEASECLVQFQDVAVPSPSAWVHRSCNVAASAWRFADGGMGPYEFRHYPEGGQGDEPVNLADDAFAGAIRELRQVLARCNLLDVFGVCALGGLRSNEQPSTEFTSGRANITLQADIFSDDPESDLEAVWSFAHEGGLVVRRCITMCRGVKKGHVMIHVKQKGIW